MGDPIANAKRAATGAAIIGAAKYLQKKIKGEHVIPWGEGYGFAAPMDVVLERRAERPPGYGGVNIRQGRPVASRPSIPYMPALNMDTDFIYMVQGYFTQSAANTNYSTTAGLPIVTGFNGTINGCELIKFTVILEPPEVGTAALVNRVHDVNLSYADCTTAIDTTMGFPANVCQIQRIDQAREVAGTQVRVTVKQNQEHDFGDAAGNGFVVCQDLYVNYITTSMVYAHSVRWRLTFKQRQIAASIAAAMMPRHKAQIP